MTKRPTHAFVVSHTHWDREWYLSVQEFRVMLVSAVKGVLDALENDDDFKHFVLDGQALCVEDYLAMCPDDRERVARLAGEGKLSLGPWYILPDEFLVSAEATVRNLLIGHEVALSLGNCQRVGYMPDSFGHVAQLPQILRRAGLDTFIYTRGNGDEIDRVGTEYRWRAPDGSEVLAVNQVKGYCNAGGLGFHEIWHAHTPRIVDCDRAVAQVTEVFDEMAVRSRTPIALLNNGCDHFPVQRDFGRVMTALREAFPDTTFVHADFAAFTDAVRPYEDILDVFEGELVSGRLHHILSGVWSARMYLKQMNEAAQNLLARVVEPLTAYHAFLHGGEVPHGQLTYLWKRLLENHPHDSICGCSTDEVHRDMIPRFDDVQRSGEALIVRTLQTLAPTFGPRAEDDRATVLTVFNPLPFPRREVVERMVVLQPFGVDILDLTMVDDEGRAIPFVVVDDQVVERFWGVDYRMLLTAREQHERFDAYRHHFASRILKPSSDRNTHDTFVTIQFEADLPPVGHARFHLREGLAGSSAVTPRSVQITDRTIANEHVAVTLHDDGTFDVVHKSTGQSYPRLNRFESEADVGDEYDFSPIAGSNQVCVPAHSHFHVVEDTGLRGCIAVRCGWDLPLEVLPDRSQRTDVTAGCGIEVRVRLCHACSRIDVETTIDNHARDHRLRAMFPTGLDADTLISDGHFYLNHRPLALPDDSEWVQPHPGTFPQQDFSCVEAGDRGFAILNRGLPEVAATRVNEPANGVEVALTLLRCVGWLSRDDFASRRNSNAGPTLYTPEAQCQGTHRFEYAIVPYEGDLFDADIPRESARYRTVPSVVQGVDAGSTPGGVGLLSHRSAKVSVSAIKRHHSRDTLVVRLVNLAATRERETLHFGLAAKRAWHVSLLEEREREILHVGESITVELAPFAIETLEIELVQRKSVP